jgi:hypothetical protein
MSAFFNSIAPTHQVKRARKSELMFLAGLPTPESSVENTDDFGQKNKLSGKARESTCCTFVWRFRLTADPSAPLPRIPVKVGGAGKLHAVFLNEDRTRRSV